MNEGKGKLWIRIHQQICIARKMRKMYFSYNYPNGKSFHIFQFGLLQDFLFVHVLWALGHDTNCCR
jgi:hypothetical protein